VTTDARPETDLRSLVDLDSYPLFALESRPERLDAWRSQLKATGAAELPGFLTPTGVAAMVAEARSLAERAYRSGGIGTAYLTLPDNSAPVGHPTRWLGPYGLGAVAYDLMPRESLLRRLYEWDPVKDLIEAILDRGPIYRYADPFGALNLAVMAAGDQLQWHFDQTDFVVSLAIEPSESGGDFEVATLIRSAAEERYDAVAGVLDGSDHSPVVTLPMTAGTLLIFEGRHSLHRVSPVQGETPRLVGLLAYDTEPGTMGSELLRQNRYGRTEALAEPPA
jgi:hypothetical protein